MFASFVPERRGVGGVGQTGGRVGTRRARMCVRARVYVCVCLISIRLGSFLSG